MQIISHRGLWRQVSEKNKEIAFQRSFEYGFGIETDVRDAMGTLVISHDMPSGGEMTLDEFLSLHGAANWTVAMNIKSDGLADALREAAKKHRLKDWFVFDMSIPDMRSHFRAGNPVFTRVSEVEVAPIWLDESAGVWMDSFCDRAYDISLISRFIEAGKRVCVVSPELHGYAPEACWHDLRDLQSSDQLILCTDHPLLARDFFRQGQ